MYIVYCIVINPPGADIFVILKKCEKSEHKKIEISFNLANCTSIFGDKTYEL